MNQDITEEEYAALIILRSTGAKVMEVALFAKDALQKGHGRVQRARKCLAVGEEELKRQERTVTFLTAVHEALEARASLRPRTLIDFRYFSKRIMRLCPELPARRVRSIRSEECSAWLEKAFASLHQRRKARAVMSGVFATAMKRGWCDDNPIVRVEQPVIKESPIPVLTAEEIKTIIRSAKHYHNGICAAAVGMMLYAGIRPHEVARLTWEQVDLKERAIYILPWHSKTGGARRVTIHKPLLALLRRYQQSDFTKICPPNWLMHWRKLRCTAGWCGEKNWPPDVLRHTYASYHLCYFRSYAELQVEIGHRDSALLRTRYVDQRGVVNPKEFWGA